MYQKVLLPQQESGSDERQQVGDGGALHGPTGTVVVTVVAVLDPGSSSTSLPFAAACNCHEELPGAEKRGPKAGTAE